VFELPALFATASAEHFAKGGVSLLNSTGIVTHLGFGTETDNLHLLSELAAVLSEEPTSYREYLHKELNAGKSFPAARSAALQHYLTNACSADLPPHISNMKSMPLHHSSHELEQILASPNNILALEYLQALTLDSSSIAPVPILRLGRGYHDTTMQECDDAIMAPDFCSASAIRSCLKNHMHSSFTAYTGRTPDMPINKDGSFPVPENAMPKIPYDILRNYPHPFLFEDNFSALLHYELLTSDCGRLFTHMLLHIRQEDYEKFPFLSADSWIPQIGGAAAIFPKIQQQPAAYHQSGSGGTYSSIGSKATAISGFACCKPIPSGTYRQGTVG